MKTKINIVAIQSNVSKDIDISINNLLKKIDEIKYKKKQYCNLARTFFLQIYCDNKNKKIS